MQNNMKLIQNSDGSYDLAITLSRSEAEFGIDFFSSKKLIDYGQQVTRFIKNSAKNLKLRSVKIIVAGVILATIPFSMMLPASAHPTEHYSMAYLYQGTAAQQLSYIDRTNNSLNMV